MKPNDGADRTQQSEFRVPPVIRFGSGSVAGIGSEARRFGQKALLVTDTNIRAAGHVDRALASLAAAGVAAAVYDGVMTEPTDAFVAEGLRAYREGNCQLVVAVGGGSPIDTAKAVAAMVTNEPPITVYMGANKLPHDPVPVIAVPTTAGTGSEVTRNTIITDTGNDVKMLIASTRIIPNVAVIDPLLSATMPRPVAAFTGIDALTHAIEAYVSRRAQPVTDTLALESIRLLGQYLRRAWADPADAEAGQHVMYAATMAGMAFSNSSVALVHGMARPIGALFHVAHGVSNAILLPTAMTYSLAGAPERFATIAEALGVDVHGLSAVEAAQRGVAAVRRLCEDVGIPGLRDLGCDLDKFREVMPRMAADALASGSPGNNPRVPEQDEIVALYEALLAQP